jgi:MYXO-CTERM domain-containing protein
VAEVTGRIALAEVSCTSPAAARQEPRPQGGQSAQPAPAPEQRTGQQGPPAPEGTADLAVTGGPDRTPYLAVGAAALLGVGASLLLRRRRAPGERG